MTEQWRGIARAPGYEVSDRGRVRSLDRIRKSDGARIRGRTLKPNVVRGGYLQVKLSISASELNSSVHRLVLEAFIGPCPPGMEGCHEDGNPANNALPNLRWGTPQSNCRQRSEHGTTAVGENNGRTKLTERLVESIRRDRSAGVSSKDLASKHGLSQQQVMRIVRGDSWRHSRG